MQHRNLPHTYPAGKGSKPVCGLKLKRTSHLWPAGGSLVWKRRERTGPWFSQASKELRNRPRVCPVTCNGCMTQPRSPFLRLLPQLGRLFYCDSLGIFIYRTGGCLTKLSPSLPGRGSYSSSLDRKNLSSCTKVSSECQWPTPYT